MIGIVSLESLRNTVSAERVDNPDGPNWPIKSGSLRFRPQPMTEAMQIGVEIVSSAYASIYELDLVIEHYAYALEIIQPSESPGKVSVRFLRRRYGGAGPALHPHIVQWYRSRNNRWLYHRLKPSEVLRKVPSYAVFQPIREDVKTLMKEVFRLIDRREASLVVINNLKRQAASLSVGTTTFSADKKDQILDWLPLLREKRERLIAQSRQAVAQANEALPGDAAPTSSSTPRVSRSGSVRGRLNQSARRTR